MIDPLIDRLIGGKYRTTRLLGQGGMGAVFEAIHTGTGRKVALKVISTADMAANAEAIARFQTEARAAGAIDTQHIVQVLDSGKDDATGHPYLVLEFLAGSDLSALIERLGPLSPNLALRIVAQACIGLQKAHEAHVVHRDIKPANLFLARRDAGEIIVKVLDFGIAKVRRDPMAMAEGHGLTRTGSILGSPSYMSPEQAKGLKTIDHRTDVWSLGAVLYEALTGRTPHDHVETLGQLIIAICAEPPPPVESIAPWVPPEAAAIVQRALRIDVAQRFQSASEMLTAIRPLLTDGWALSESQLRPLRKDQHTKILTAAIPLPGRTAPGFGGSSSLGGAATPVMPTIARTLDGAHEAFHETVLAAPVRRRRWPLAFGGAATLVAIAAAGIFGWRHVGFRPGVSGAAAPAEEIAIAPSAETPQIAPSSDTPPAPPEASAAPPAPPTSSAAPSARVDARHPAAPSPTPPRTGQHRSPPPAKTTEPRASPPAPSLDRKFE